MMRTIARLAASMLAGVALSASAQDWPTKPIRLIVPFGQGGVVDTVFAATRLAVEQRLGQKFVVEYRPGAGGNVGMQAVLAAGADGYTFAVAPSNTITINQYLFKSMPFDPLRDFVPVTMLVDVPLVLSVSAKHPVTSLREFIENARANPGKINFGSPGPATPPHLASELFARTAGLQLVHVPYKGGNAAAVALIANDVQMMLIAYASLRGQIQGGLVRPLAVAATERVGGLPNVPTFAEAGFADLQRAMPRSWWSLVAPRGTSDAIIARLQSEFRAALLAPDARARFAEAGLIPVGSTPADFGSLWPEEAARWSKLIQEIGLKLD
jgi:tripartite-type tricarboxylate transporter receptor subunit TctC